MSPTSSLGFTWSWRTQYTRVQLQDGGNMFEIYILVYWRELPGCNMQHYLHEEWNSCTLYKNEALKWNFDVCVHISCWQLCSSPRLKDNKETTYSFSPSLVDKLLDWIMIVGVWKVQRENTIMLHFGFWFMVLRNTFVEHGYRKAMEWLH